MTVDCSVFAYQALVVGHQQSASQEVGHACQYRNRILVDVFSGKTAAARMWTADDRTSGKIASRSNCSRSSRSSASSEWPRYGVSYADSGQARKVTPKAPKACRRSRFLDLGRPATGTNRIGLCRICPIVARLFMVVSAQWRRLDRVKSKIVVTPMFSGNVSLGGLPSGTRIAVQVNHDLIIRHYQRSHVSAIGSQARARAPVFVDDVTVIRKMTIAT